MRRSICMVIFLMPALCLGQTTEDSWDNLKQLRAGQKIEVVDMDLKSLKGKFVRLSDDAISLETKAGEVTLERERVFRVSARGGGRSTNALVGVALGTATGLVLGSLGDYLDDVDSSDPGANNKKISCSLIGALAGGGVGAAFPGWHTVYRAKKARNKER